MAWWLGSWLGGVRAPELRDGGVREGQPVPTIVDGPDVRGREAQGGGQPCCEVLGDVFVLCLLCPLRSVQGGGSAPGAPCRRGDIPPQRRVFFVLMLSVATDTSACGRLRSFQAGLAGAERQAGSIPGALGAELLSGSTWGGAQHVVTALRCQGPDTAGR